ncbi:hypothetical protein CKM354_000769000 [Cercospora kikuchii]|uniref:Uncharacterized protein n=1 Tax=Cercospora kikuchii TaxID=84275 RepID=A0A9P3FEK1_9PEZI|nr:uncharacterized protein CKM354_000769000 [Cercospora kikuchii]GIZ44493.1 hypothetical protein CKM354_000769000 [Cercospora kikuchii]
MIPSTWSIDNLLSFTLRGLFRLCLLTWGARPQPNMGKVRLPVDSAPPPPPAAHAGPPSIAGSHGTPNHTRGPASQG